MKALPVFVCAAAMAAAVACSGANSASSGGVYQPPSGFGGSSPGGGTGATGGNRGAPDAGSLPPEAEVETSYEVPVATGRYIWVANPASGRVAYVEGTTLNVHTIEAGNAPTYIASIPGAAGDAVIVLNVLSHDATILRVASDGTLAKATVSGIAGGANALTVSPGGRWAIAWTDSRRLSTSDPLQGYQAVTVIDLGAKVPAANVLSVGFRPVAVAYAADESAAFAVTQDGVSVVALGAAGGPRVTGNVALTSDPTEDADTRDVSITPNGRLALVRRNGDPTIGIADLSTGTLGSITLSGAVTDLDVTADGSQAVAVVRDTAEVAILPLGAGIPAAAAVQHVTVTGETVGSASVAADGKTALLYTNAVPSQRLVVLTLGAAPAYRVVKLHAPILAVFPTPDASSAVVFHSQSAPPAVVSTGSDGGARADGGVHAVDAGIPSQLPTNAFSLVPLAAGLPAAIQETDVPPQAVAITPAGDRVLVSESDEKKQVFGVYVGQFPSLRIQKIPLASPPIAVGVLAGANQGYVAQKNPQGRITFIELATSQARTLTGFEIGASVVDWASVSDGGVAP